MQRHELLGVVHQGLRARHSQGSTRRISQVKRIEAAVFWGMGREGLVRPLLQPGQHEVSPVGYGTGWRDGDALTGWKSAPIFPSLSTALTSHINHNFHLSHAAPSTPAQTSSHVGGAARNPS